MLRGSSKFLPSLVPAHRLGRDVPDRGLRDQARRPVPSDRDPLRRSPRSASSPCCGRSRAAARCGSTAAASSCSLFGSAGIAGFNLLAFAGLEHTTPEHAALIVATSPLMTLLASAALARKAPPAGHVRVRDPRARRRADGDRPRRPGGGLQRRHQQRRRARLPRHGELRRLHARRAPLHRLLVAALHRADARPAARSPCSWSPRSRRWPAGTPRPRPPTWRRSGGSSSTWSSIGALAAVLCWNKGVRRLGAPNAALYMNLVPVVAFIDRDRPRLPAGRWSSSPAPR